MNMLDKGSKLFVEDKTFRAKKKFPFLQASSNRDQLKEYIVQTMGAGNLRAAVQLPRGQDRNEWLAINTVDFYNQVNLIYGCIADFCTKESCAVMSAGKKYEYLLWPDPKRNTKTTTCSAPEYISKLMEWIEDQLDDESVFPKSGKFPADFESNTVKTIFKRLFRVYAHIYYSHLPKIESLGEQRHLNTCFKHFMYFVDEYDLVDKQERKPLAQIIEQILGTGAAPAAK